MSNTSKQKNHRNDAMKLLTDLLSTNTGSMGITIKGDQDNSKSKKQYTKASKSNSLLAQKEMSKTQERFDFKRSGKNKKQTQQLDLKIMYDSSIFYEKVEDLDMSTNEIISQSSNSNANLKLLESKQILLTVGSDQQTEENQCKRNFVYEHQSFKESEKYLNKQKGQYNKLFNTVFVNKNEGKRMNSSVQTRQRIEYKKKECPKINEFEIGKKLGGGKFGQVFAAKHIKLGFICALKKIKKVDVESQALVQLIRQIKIQGFLDHPNIAKLYNFFSDENCIYLMMEYCASGDMYAFLKKRKRLQQSTVRNLMRQVCKAIEYMHENSIIHRDLKPQNILLNNGMVKICDFGWSISSTINRETFCGTPLYVSPELLKRNNYNNKIDVWSIGIMTHQLLFGSVPFDIFSEEDLIKIDDIHFSKKHPISQNAKNFILSCLQKDPRQRSTVLQLLDHPFLKTHHHQNSQDQL